MEGLLRSSSKACKEAAAVTSVWIRDTHHSLQKQELRWECLRQEVREQKKEVRNLVVEGQGIRQNHDKHEERLQQLENLVSQKGQALVELNTKCESEFEKGKLVNAAVRRPKEVIKAGKPTLQR